jgi:septal ring factor EnvC (AmiA/AmiB activator)
LPQETSIDEAEKKMAALIDSLHTVQQNVTKLEKNGRQIDVELLSRFRGLAVHMAAEERELQVRQIGLQKAREAFVRELSDYEVMIGTKLDTMEHMGEQLKGLSFEKLKFEKIKTN